MQSPAKVYKPVLEERKRERSASNKSGKPKRIFKVLSAKPNQLNVHVPGSDPAGQPLASAQGYQTQTAIISPNVRKFKIERKKSQLQPKKTPKQMTTPSYFPKGSVKAVDKQSYESLPSGVQMSSFHPSQLRQDQEITDLPLQLDHRRSNSKQEAHSMQDRLPANYHSQLPQQYPATARNFAEDLIRLQNSEIPE